MRRWIMALVLVASMQAVWADFNNGVVAYLSGDYEQAFHTMRSLAETTDHALAQYYMGMMYMRGQGAEQDYSEAGEWFRRAAEQSIPQAQYRLGTLYMNGQGVPQDYEFAYAWFKAGAAHAHKLSTANIDKAKASLSTTELAEAEKLAAGFVEKFGPKPEEAEAPQQGV